MEVVFDHKQKLNSEITSYFFVPSKPLHYIAGQFIELTLPIAGNASEKNRWFTLSSSPTEKLLSITTRHPRDLSNFKKHLAKMKPGDVAHMSQAMGDFVLPKDPQIPLVFVAAGIGITPMRSMLASQIESRQKRHINTLYFVKSHADACFVDLLKSTSTTLDIIVTKSKNSISSMIENIHDYSSTNGFEHVYLSGPEPLVENLSNHLSNEGYRDYRLHTDFFPGYNHI
jgi:ferredoxin-NADP reductase